MGSGSFDEADAGIARGLELIKHVIGAQFSGPVHGAAAERELWRHDPKAALGIVDQGLAQLAETTDWQESWRLCRVGAWAAADLAEAARTARDDATVATAIERVATLQAEFERATRAGRTAGPGRSPEADRANLAAEATRVEGTPDAGAWRTAARLWTEHDRPYYAALARWREAEACLAMGDRPEAGEALRAAHLGASRLGARPLLESVTALARRARISLEVDDAVETPTPAEIDRYGLTPRELEVLELLAEGRTNRQIAEALFISESTAGVHVSNILGKLGATNRVEAAAIAYRMGATADSLG